MEKIKKFLKEIVTLIIMFLVISFVFNHFMTQDLNKDNLELHDLNLVNNEIYNYDNEKPILLYFWATWCPTCKFQSSNVDTLSKDYNVLTIVTQSGNNKKIENYLKEKELNFKVYNDFNGYFQAKFNIEVFPTVLIYDKDSKLKFTEVGYTSTLGLYTRMKLTD